MAHRPAHLVTHRRHLDALSRGVDGLFLHVISQIGNGFPLAIPDGSEKLVHHAFDLFQLIPGLLDLLGDYAVALMSIGENFASDSCSALVLILDQDVDRVDQAHFLHHFHFDDLLILR